MFAGAFSDVSEIELVLDCMLSTEVSSDGCQASSDIPSNI